MLIGASTASAIDLDVPVGIRQPFNTAIPELEKADLFQEVAKTGNKTEVICV